jgi:hypothetical protein
MSCDYDGPFHDYNCPDCSEIEAKTVAQQEEKHRIYEQLSTTVYPTTDNTKGALARVILFGIIAIGIIVYLTQYA